MWMEEERIPKKKLHTKMEEKWPGGRTRTRWLDQIRKNIEMRGKMGRNTRKKEMGD